jgi:hypothetical protein
VIEYVTTALNLNPRRKKINAEASLRFATVFFGLDGSQANEIGRRRFDVALNGGLFHLVGSLSGYHAHSPICCDQPAPLTGYTIS